MIMDLIQTIRRLSQHLDYWDYAINDLYSQMIIINKLYSKNGLKIDLTCCACPEQYDIYRGRVLVAYYRLRHGEFTVEMPDCGDKCVFYAAPNGDGIFDCNERLIYLTKAMRIVIKELKLTK